MWDGVRGIAYIRDCFTNQSRNDKKLKHFLPDLEEPKQLTTDVVVDSEIVTIKNSKVDFHSPQERPRYFFQRNWVAKDQSPAIYIVLDILEKDGNTLVDVPLTERKTILKQSVKEGSNIIINDIGWGEGVTVLSGDLAA